MYQRIRTFALAAAAAVSLAFLPATVNAVPLEMTYQAQLVGSVSNSPINSNNVDVAIRLYDGAGLGATLLDTQIFSGLDLSSTNGFVNLVLDMTSVSLAGDLYVEVVVDDLNDASPAETLSPRQKITSVAFALDSGTLEGDSLTDVQTYADGVAATAQTNAQTYADGVAATAQANAISSAQTYADGVASTAETNAISAAQLYTDTAFANFNRIVVVNPDITQSGTPDGSFTDPFDNIADAYAFAKTLPSAGSFFDRIAVLLMPGRHDIGATTVTLDTTGIDLVGMIENTPSVEGTADPLIEITAGTSGASIRDLALNADSGSTNRCLLVSSGGRLKNVQFRRMGASAATAGTLLEAGVSTALSVRTFEVYGDVLVTSYGPGNTTFNDGFILGDLTSTGTSAGTELLALVNMSAVGDIDFNPAGAGVGVGIFAITNLLTAGTPTISGAETVVQFGNVNFAGAAIADPLAGSAIINSIADITGWTGVLAASPGNVPTAYVAFATK